MKDKRIEMMETASILYFEENKSQNEIAKLMGISRSYVSQLLISAKKTGVVDIKINISETKERHLRKEVKIMSMFPLLKQVYIMESESPEYSAINIGKFGASYVSDLISKSKCIGVNPGKSVQKLINNLDSTEIEIHESKKIVQIMGGFSKSKNRNTFQPNEMVNRLKDIIGGDAYYFNVPAVVDEPNLKKALLNQKEIKSILAIWESIDLALMGIGVTDKKSILINNLDKKIAVEIEKRGVCGEINLNFFSQKGKIISIIDDIKMGITLEAYRKIKSKVVISSTVDKAKALIGALRAGLIDILITDSLTADEMINNFEKEI